MRLLELGLKINDVGQALNLSMRSIPFASSSQIVFSSYISAGAGVLAVDFINFFSFFGLLVSKTMFKVADYFDFAIGKLQQFIWRGSRGFRLNACLNSSAGALTTL